MSFDAWIVGFGLSRVLIELELIASSWAYSVLAGTILLDIYLLYIFFTTRRAAAERPQPTWARATRGDPSGPPDCMPLGVAALPRDPLEPR